MKRRLVLRSAPLARVSKDGHSNVSFIILRGSPDGAPAQLLTFALAGELTDDVALLAQPAGAVPPDPSEARVFDNVINSLQHSYPQDKLADISTSFCFICLLHLANERGLKLETDVSRVSAEEEDNMVGNIWGLKVCSLSFSAVVATSQLAVGVPRSKRRSSCVAPGLLSCNLLSCTTHMV